MSNPYRVVVSLFFVACLIQIKHGSEAKKRDLKISTTTSTTTTSTTQWPSTTVPIEITTTGKPDTNSSMETHKQMKWLKEKETEMKLVDKVLETLNEWEKFLKSKTKKYSFNRSKGFEAYLLMINIKKKYLQNPLSSEQYTFNEQEGAFNSHRKRYMLGRF